MDSDLKCNRLSCRRSLSDKAVVTTCSHIFCIECANELFSAARLCPGQGVRARNVQARTKVKHSHNSSACDTTLTEPDDVVVCSLQPTNDYKTSVLSGLTPSIILEICSRAISFWQYQIHQESTFQQAVVRNLNDKNAQLQKQFDNVVREANGELALLNNKKGELERDLELERRKVRELQDASRERDKEYAKIKSQFDKLKRKTLLGEGISTLAVQNPHFEDQRLRPRQTVPSVNLNNLVVGMENSVTQRTPLIARPQGRVVSGNTLQMATANEWLPHSRAGYVETPRNAPHRQPFNNFIGHAGDHVHASGTISDRSESANEVEQMLNNHQPRNSIPAHHGWQYGPQNPRPVQRIFAGSNNSQRTSRGFRPVVQKP